MFNQVTALLHQIKQQQPLIINLTNLVTMDFIANGLLSIGASPIMSQSIHELDDLFNAAHALVINIGTLNEAFMELCIYACENANRLNIPIVLDPAGAGASIYRTQACFRLIDQFDIAVIRGNSSEIMALCGLKAVIKGVDSKLMSTLPLKAAQHLSARSNATIVISGAIDRIVTQQQHRTFTRGSSMMPSVTGSGCLLTAIIGTFIAIQPQAFIAATAGVLFYSIAGEIAAHHAKGPGTFKPHFLDALSYLPKAHDYE